MFDVVMAVHDETNAEEHWQRLLARRPGAIRVSGAKDIREAYGRAAASVVTTHFFMVDGDNWLLDSFSFEIDFRPFPDETVFWLSRNPINSLITPHGAIKLVPTAPAMMANAESVDVGLSIGNRARVVQEIASEHRFNASPLEAWRASFRECAKLASGAVFPESRAHRDFCLDVWGREESRAPFWQWCLLGARQGRAFGEACAAKTRRYPTDQRLRLAAHNFPIGETGSRQGTAW
jgi:hypothetical protein